MNSGQSNEIFALLVEGEDDENFVNAVISILSLDLSIDIRVSEGISKLFQTIPLHIKAPGRKAVGIILDANDDLTNRWEQVKEILRAENVCTPSNPKIGGTIIPPKNRHPRIGIWLMPDNKSNGELENFVVQMIPDTDIVWPLAQNYISEIPENSRKFRASKMQRAKLHAWLATREIPGRIGAAIRRGDLETNGKLTRQFVKWLTSLYQ